MNREDSCQPSLKEKALIPNPAGLESKPRDQGQISESITNAVIKVKRRKTKKERNSIKFKMHKETVQKKGWLHNYLQRHDGGSNLHGPKIIPHSSGKKAFMQVFITQDRLTQHQGIFDHEVKSVNIERFVRETTEVEPAKIDTGIATIQSKRRTPGVNLEVSLGLIPTPEVKDQEELPLNQESSEKLDSTAAETREMKVPQPQGNSQQAVNSTPCIHGSGSHLESTLPGCLIEDFPEEMKEAPVHEAAESIHNMLSLLNLFPGRNLVEETRKSIKEKVKKLSGTSSNQSAPPLQRMLNYISEADTPTKSQWENASEGGTCVRKTTRRPQGHMQSTPVHFMHLPRGSPGHMVIKMIRPDGGQQIVSPVLHQPVRSESGYDPSLQHHHIFAENSPHLLTVQLSSEVFRPSKQDRDPLICCKGSRHRLKHVMQVNADSPQVRWTFAGDEIVYTNNTHQKYIKCNANQRMVDQEWLPGQPFISLEEPNTSEPRARSSSSRQPSFNVLHNIFSHNSDNSQMTKTFGVSPLKSRAFYSCVSSPQPKSKRHHDICHKGHGTQESRFQFEDPLRIRYIKQNLSSPLGMDVDPPHDIFCSKSLQRSRNINVPSDCTIWNSPSSVRQATSDMEWHCRDSWSHRSHQYSQWRKRPMVMPPTSVEQESSVVGLPYAGALRKDLTDKPSPETWVYPRMKLY